MTARRVPVSAEEQAFRDAEFDAHPQWARGEVVPAMITILLDARDLYGPDVDLACSAVEPAVDEWEAGTRYPTFQQLIALARLCHTVPTVFFHPVQHTPGPVFLCDRRRPSQSRVLYPPPPINTYPQEVWQPVVDGHRDTLFDLEPTGAPHMNSIARARLTAATLAGIWIITIALLWLLLPLVLHPGDVLGVLWYAAGWIVAAAIAIIPFAIGSVFDGKGY